MKKIALVLSLGVLQHTFIFWLNHVSHKIDTLGTLPDGREVGIFALIIANEMSAEPMEFEAIICNGHVSDHDGYLEYFVLGRDDFGGLPE